MAKDGIQVLARARVTVRTNLKQLVGGATEETIVARVGEGIVSTIGSSETHKQVLENPDEISKKSLRLLDKKLQWLAEHAHFDVNINSVVGGGIKNPEDARTINRRARELGFSTSIGIIHDGSGLLKPLGAAERAVFDEVMRLINGQRQVVKNLYSGIRNFQTNLADGKPARAAAAG